MRKARASSLDELQSVQTALMYHLVAAANGKQRLLSPSFLDAASIRARGRLNDDLTKVQSGSEQSRFGALKCPKIQ
jgi:hypothetical protein